MDFFNTLKKAVADSGPKPVVTWLGEAGRIELSTVTFANAVSKASNFLIDGLELDEDSSIAVELGNHWQSPVWFGAAFATGITITNQSPTITFGTAARAAVWTDSPESFVLISQDPFGMPDKNVDPKFVNGSAEVRNFGDYFSPAWPLPPESFVVRATDRALTWDELKAVAQQVATSHDLQSGKSYGFCGNADPLKLISLQVVLPIAFGSAVVLIEQTNADFDDIKKQEKLDQIVELG
jgi:uncharacterized protein (TIGR03089 family)